MDLGEVGRRENISQAKLKAGLRKGSIVLVKNRKRKIEPIAIGSGVATKVNANIGTSPGLTKIGNELKKARAAIDAGTDTLMDLSIEGQLDKIRGAIIKNTKVPLGTVPIYQAFKESGLDMSLADYLNALEKHCRDGVDFVTIHSGIRKEILPYLKKRIIPITSRGGSFLASWMLKNKKENPLYTGFDEILEILKEYEVVISLGDALRPATIHDATDYCQLHELKVLGKLTKRAKKAGVQVIIEGPGHVPLDQIESNVKLEKKICDNAPFYVLGPLVTDIAIGYDHITGAIGGAIASAAGADFLCYVTPSEHLGLPETDDVVNGVVASKIAAHAGDLVKLRQTARDDRLSKARRKLDWNEMFKLCINPKIREKYPKLKGKDVCTMCGEYCALKIL